MSAVPVPGGDVAVIFVLEFTVNADAAVPANEIALAPLKLEPLMVTMVPPVDGPPAGLTLVTTGAGTYVNRSALLVADVPPVVVTVTWTVPEPGGLVATTAVDDVLAKNGTATPPNRTTLV